MTHLMYNKEYIYICFHEQYEIPMFVWSY